MLSSVQRGLVLDVQLQRNNEAALYLQSLSTGFLIHSHSAVGRVRQNSTTGTNEAAFMDWMPYLQQWYRKFQHKGVESYTMNFPLPNNERQGTEGTQRTDANHTFIFGKVLAGDYTCWSDTGVGVACPRRSLVNASTGLPRMLIRAKSLTTLPTTF